MSNKERSFTPRALQPAAAEEAATTAEEIKQAWLDPDRQPVTAENIEQVLAEAPVPKRSEILRQPTETWPASDVAHRLRQCINFLHAHGMIPDGEAVRLKEEVETQENS